MAAVRIRFNRSIAAVATLLAAAVPAAPAIGHPGHGVPSDGGLWGEIQHILLSPEHALVIVGVCLVTATLVWRWRVVRRRR